MEYDFSGWATRNDIKCSDGRTIRHDAFKDCDGLEVPLVWNHCHNEPDNVLGHVILHNCDEGVRCDGVFNSTSSGQCAKVLVNNGDIRALSIYANQLKQIAKDVVHGMIREVSLVHAGANPGAYIDTIIAHSDDCDEEAIIYTGESLFHSEEKNEDKKEEKKVADEPKNPEKESGKDKTIGDVLDTLNEEQQSAVEVLLGMALEEAEGKNDNDDDEDEEEKDMKHNAFYDENDSTLMHAALDTIIKDAKRCGSMKESFIQHSAEYGIENIDYLFPEAKSVNGNVPGFITNQPSGWVQRVLNGVHHTPWAKVKMAFADITEEDARAKGYTKGNLKKEEVFTLLKRTVNPTTVYKKQKMDRDDVIDITDFDVISWIKAEMRLKLDEELARAILFGDGRSSASDDKIDESNIIPLSKDASLYTIQANVTVSQSATDDDKAKAFVKAAVKGQDTYEGAGKLILFTSRAQVTNLLLLEDEIGHRLYKNKAELALALNVDSIEEVPASIIPAGTLGVIVDLSDYNVGADKGGAINMFDDFDIDYNQQKYLIETRCSGALTKPRSAIVLKEVVSGNGGE